MLYDILIVGGGPAGLTAALYAARAGKSALLIERDSIGGQIVFSPLVENYPALPHVSGAAFANSLYEQVEALGVTIETAEVSAADRTESGFRLTTDLGAREGRALILATGVQHRSLGLPDEEDLVGAGISYCAVCDGAFYAGRDVAVVGGGDTALQDALFLSGVCRAVTLIVRRDRFRGEAALVKKLAEKPNISVRFNSVPTGYLTREGELTGLKLHTPDGARDLLVDGVFLAVGQVPCSEAFAALVGTDAAGYYEAGEDCRTDVPGVFAAGDCRVKGVRQLTTAVGDGAVAALAACDWVDRA